MLLCFSVACNSYFHLRRSVHSIIAQIPNGSEVEILGEDGDWLRVHFGEERSGYVFAAYIERKAQSEAAETAQEAQRSRKTIRITDENGDIYDVAGAFTVRVLED